MLFIRIVLGMASLSSMQMQQRPGTGSPPTTGEIKYIYMRIQPCIYGHATIATVLSEQSHACPCALIR